MRRLAAGAAPGRRTAGGAPRPGQAARWATTAALAGAAALGVALGIAACSAAATAGATGTSCGTTRTAAGAAVRIDVVKGTVDCAAALRAEAGYTDAIKDGELRGNGGGAPLSVNGWTCESYSAVQAVRTGDASECHTANAEVVAALSAPSGFAPESTGS